MTSIFGSSVSIAVIAMLLMGIFSGSSISHFAFADPADAIGSYKLIGDGSNGGPSLADGDRFGQAVDNINDLNVDGINDIAVGAPQDDTGGINAGAIHILFTNADGTAKGTSKIASGLHGGPVLAANDQFGLSLSGLGDLNKDGYQDIAVGAPLTDGAGTNQTDRGAVYILFMEEDGTVTSYTKIDESTTSGLTLANSDRFGQSVRMIGDLDSDGVQDIAVGAFQDDTGGANRGAVYILFMNANGTVKSLKKIASDMNGAPTLADGDQFGVSVANIGDFDHDGVSDIAVGSYHDKTGGNNRGAFYLLFMNTDGSVKSSTKVASGTAGLELHDSDEFGRSIALLSDLDNNSVPDIAAAGYEDDTVANNAGAIYLFYMNANGTVSSFDKITGGINGGPALTASEAFGRSMAAIGDRNEDGIIDLAVGVDGNDAGHMDDPASNRGAVYILYLNAKATSGGGGSSEEPVFTYSLVTDKASVTLGQSVTATSTTNNTLATKTVFDWVNPSNVTAFTQTVSKSGTNATSTYTPTSIGTWTVKATFTSTDGATHFETKTQAVTVGAAPEEPTTTSGPVKLIAHLKNGGPSLQDGDFFGRSVANMGDLNGDGIADLAVAADFDDTGGSNTGAVYILFMNAEGRASSVTKIASNIGGGPTLSAGDVFGRYIANAGDLDGDGRAELAVGAFHDNTGGTGRGAVYILYLNADGTVQSLKTKKIASGLNGGPTLADGDLFGQSVFNIGDRDNDGVSDIAVGASQDATGGPNRGAFYILHMNTDGSVKSLKKIASDMNGAPTLADGDFFGRSIALLSDLDGNGVKDLAVSAYLDDTGGDKRGAVYILFMNANETVKSSKKIASGLNGGPTLHDSDEFGQVVISLADVNGDGTPDIAVGAPRDDTGSTNSSAERGALYILFMNPDGTVSSFAKMASGMNGIPALSDIDLLGFSAISLGDINGDGKQDLAIAAAGDSTGGSQRGGVYTLLGYTSMLSQSTTPVSSPIPNSNVTVNTKSASGKQITFVIHNISSGGSVVVTETNATALNNSGGGNIFQSVGSGTATLTIGGTAGSTAGTIFEINLSNITFGGTIDVTIPYNQTALPSGFDENKVKFLHWTGSAWEDVTVSVDTVAKTVTGRLSSFSPVVAGYAIPTTTTPSSSGGSFIGGGGGGGSVILNPSFPADYFNTNPLAKIQIQDSSFKNLAGDIVLGAKPGQQVSINASFKNYQQTTQNYAIIIQVVDQNGFTTDIGWVTGTVDAGKTVDNARSWTPETAGNYTIKIFVWDNVSTTPLPLSEITTKYFAATL